MPQALFGTTNSLPPPLFSPYHCPPPLSFSPSLRVYYQLLLSIIYYTVACNLEAHKSVLPSYSSQSKQTEHSVFPCLPLTFSCNFSIKLSALNIRSHHMAAIVCHGLQSHLESQLVESRPFRLRLNSSKPDPTQSVDLAFKSRFWDSNIKIHHEENANKTDTFQNKPISSNPNTGGWSFLDTLSNISQGTKEPSQKETAYVHPQQKGSSLLLSPKSLELCTANLGNESGTEIAENGIDMFSSSNCAGGNLGTGEQRQPCQLLAAKKAKTHNFPPPLTTIRGSESLRVRPHREDGRLVIEVTKVPPSTSCFQAERSHGRLRLCFLTNHATSFDPEEEVIDDNGPTPNEGFDEEFFENEMGGQIQDAEAEEEEETGEEAEQEEYVACVCEEQEMKGGDVRMDKYGRLRRCKEGGDHENTELLSNLSEPLWVATA